jgi:hypothetical protein
MGQDRKPYLPSPEVHLTYSLSYHASRRSSQDFYLHSVVFVALVSLWFVRQYIYTVPESPDWLLPVSSPEV